MSELTKERREKLRAATQYPFKTILVQAPDPVDTVSIDFSELRVLLDMADERDELEKAVDPRNKRPSGMSIVKLAEWKTYLASVRDRVLMLVSSHSRDEDSDADDTVEWIVNERDRYRALLEMARDSLDYHGRIKMVRSIDAALEGNHD